MEKSKIFINLHSCFFSFLSCSHFLFSLMLPLPSSKSDKMKHVLFSPTSFSLIIFKKHFLTPPWLQIFSLKIMSPPIISIKSWLSIHLLSLSLPFMFESNMLKIFSHMKPFSHQSISRNQPPPPLKDKTSKMFTSVSFSLQLLLILISFPIFSTSKHATTILSNKNLPSNMDSFELETLYKIMDALSSDQKWRISCPNPCQSGSGWPGIECKFSGIDNHFHVTRLDFGTPPNPLCKNSATFPSEIFQLPHLESIFIFQCFTQAPTRILISPNKPFTSPLQQLSLRSNSALIGTIPPQLSSLKSLQILTLSQNRLTGQIPVEVFSLSSLVHLDLSYNMLTGTIPLEIGNLGNLVGLDLSYNKLIGPIPSAIGELRILQKLDLSSNSLTGTIPDSINQLQSLVFLALSNNRLRGDFPKGLISLHNLQYFLMDDNPMFVSLPVEFGQLKKLQELRLSNSGYSGTIPSAYSQLMNLSSLSLQNNRLSGKIPAGFMNLSHIYHLNLSRNLLEGVVPFNSSFLKRLGRNLDLSGNQGLCLSPSESDGVNVGVGVCGNSKTSSLVKPLQKSEAAPSHCSNVFIVNVGLIFLTFHQTLCSG